MAELTAEREAAIRQVHVKCRQLGNVWCVPCDLLDELDRLREPIKVSLQADRAACEKALLTLAGARIATPQESYGTNTSWAISDLCQAVHDQSQRITQLNMALAWAHKVIARGAEVAREKGDTADWSRVCDDCAATLPAIQPYVNGGQQ